MMIEVIAEAGVYQAMWVRLRYSQLHQRTVFNELERWIRNGWPEGVDQYIMIDAPENHCTFSGCDGKLRRRGLCAPHLGQLYRGERLAPIARRRGAGPTVKIRAYPFPFGAKMVLR